jgi:hypothetical protein
MGLQGLLQGYLYLYKFLMGKPEGNKSLGTPMSRWEDNIKMDIEEIGLDGVVCNEFIWLKTGTSSRLLLSLEMNLRFP